MKCPELRERLKAGVSGFSNVVLFVAIFGAFSSELSSAADSSDAQPRVIYPKRTELDFDGLQIEGEVRNPGEFYFRRRPEEKLDSLVKRRSRFHREMLRDVVLSK